jgi:hypothetical protein
MALSSIGIRQRGVAVAAMFLLVSSVTLVSAVAHGDALPDLNKPGADLGGGEKDAALIIGVEDYFVVPDIPGAVDNANAWRTYLRKMRKVPHVKVLRDGDATNVKPMERTVSS